MASVIGAAFGGAMAVTGTSGPGVSLKSEAMGLAVMTELPMLVVNVQRAGPSTGLPTKTEQADLNQALFGRHGECPLPVLAREESQLTASRWLSRRGGSPPNYMTPVMILSDAYVANGSEPWRIPEIASLPKISVPHPGPQANGVNPIRPTHAMSGFHDPWALPGTPGLMHRIGGLESQDQTGAVSYDPANHEYMIRLRARKIAGIADDVPPQEVEGPESGSVLVVSWGGTYGAVATSVRQLWEDGASGGPCSLALSPSPFRPIWDASWNDSTRVVVPELNAGQLLGILRKDFLVDAVGLDKITGRPFTVAELVEGIQQQLK